MRAGHVPGVVSLDCGMCMRASPTPLFPPGTIPVLLAHAVLSPREEGAEGSRASLLCLSKADFEAERSEAEVEAAEEVRKGGKKYFRGEDRRKEEVRGSPHLRLPFS